MTKDLYEENKRLKAEISRLQGQRQDDYTSKMQREKIAGDLAIEAFTGFFKGQSALVVEPANNGAFIITFRI